MLIYDYYADRGILGVIFSGVMSIVFLTGAVIQIIVFVRSYRREHPVELFARGFAFVITSVLLISFIRFFIPLEKGFYLYATQDYTEVSGTLSEVSGEAEEYRNSVFYNISFYVDDMRFEDTNVRCSREVLERMIGLEGEKISVAYLTDISEKGEQHILTIRTD